MLSGLAFPGLGQIFLKHYTKAVIIISVVLVSTFAVIFKAVEMALAVLEKIESESAIISLYNIRSAADQALTSPGSLVISIGLLVILLCWIIATIDAYRIGRKIDEKKGTNE